jgi:hypothetical protein
MGTDTLLLMRHVATVDGAGGRLPIVWDVSQQHYKFRHPRETNPRFKRMRAEAEERAKKGLPPRRQLDPLFAVSPVLTISGTLDAVLAMAQPIAQGESKELPNLSHAPTATDVEKAAILGAY